MTPHKTMVPRTHIPKFNATCPKCEHGTIIHQATPYAAGYHRRHLCKNTGCQTTFYSLTPYNGGDAQVSALPFKDRALTEAEEAERLGWWQEASRMEVTVKVTADPFLQRINHALQVKENERTQIEQAIVNTFNRLKKAVEDAEKE